MKKKIIIVLTFILMLTTYIPVVTYADNTVNLIQNGGFEKGLVNNQIPGWHIDYGGEDYTEEDVLVTLEETNVKTGKYSVRISDKSKKHSVILRSERFEIEGGAGYQLTSNNYINDASVRVYIKMYDSNGKIVLDENDLDNHGSTWKEFSLKTIAPRHAKTAEVLFYMGVGGVSEAIIDDVSFTRVTQAQKPMNIEYEDSVNLGSGVTAPLSQNAGFQTVDGQLLQYVFINGSPGVFYAVDALSGERLFEKKLENHDTAWTMAPADNGNVYFAGTNTGEIYEYNHRERKLSVLVDLKTEMNYSWVWHIVAEGNELYVATYKGKHGGKIFRVNIDDKKVTDMGIPVEGQDYVRGLGMTEDYLYAGVGGTKGHIVRYSRTDIDNDVFNPEVFYEFGESVAIPSEVTSYNGKVLAMTASHLYIFDEHTHELLDDFAFNGKFSAPNPQQTDDIYFKADMHDLYKMNLNTLEKTKVEGIRPLAETALKDMSWHQVDRGNGVENLLVSMAAYTETYFYNPLTNEIQMVYPNVDANGIQIQSMEIGNDGNLYVGGYHRGLGIVDTGSGDILHNFASFHQSEGIAFYDDDAYFGTYGGAVIYHMNIKETIDYNEFGKGNPGILFDIEDDQDRPFALLPTKDKVYVGSTPDYGKLGGAITVIQKDGSSAKTYRNIIENQAIVGLAMKDDILYASSSIVGGMGSTSTEKDAEVVMIDTKTMEVIKRVQPKIPDFEGHINAIGSLSFGPDGNLWSATGKNGTVFAMNPETLEVVKSAELVLGGKENNSFRPFYLYWGNDELLYTNVGNKISVLNIETMQHEIISHEPSAIMSMNREGDIFYAKGADIIKIPIAYNQTIIETNKQTFQVNDEIKIFLIKQNHNGIKASDNELSLNDIDLYFAKDGGEFTKLDMNVRHKMSLVVDNGKLIVKEAGNYSLKIVSKDNKFEPVIIDSVIVEEPQSESPNEKPSDVPEERPSDQLSGKPSEKPGEAPEEKPGKNSLEKPKEVEDNLPSTGKPHYAIYIGSALSLVGIFMLDRKKNM